MEGGAAEVEYVFEQRIMRDPRYTDITVSSGVGRRAQLSGLEHGFRQHLQSIPEGPARIPPVPRNDRGIPPPGRQPRAHPTRQGLSRRALARYDPGPRGRAGPPQKAPGSIRQPALLGGPIPARDRQASQEFSLSVAGPAAAPPAGRNLLRRPVVGGPRRLGPRARKRAGRRGRRTAPGFTPICIARKATPETPRDRNGGRAAC